MAKSDVEEREFFIGTVHSRKKNFWVKPDDSELQIKVSGNFERLKKFRKTKAKVIVKLLSRKNLRGEIVDVVQGDAEVAEIILNHGVVERFPAEVQAEAAKVEKVPSAEEISKRVDRRHLKIVTIDSDDAKDLDDGVFAEKIDGGYFLGVYIADVSHYVRPNSALDKEAFERGTSIYPVDRVIPMLPAELSNGICSLNEKVDRLAMACEMILDSGGKVQSYEIFPTVIHVYKRLTYAQVNRFFDGQTLELLPCKKILGALREVYELRKKLRANRGAIDFDIPEMKITLDKDGTPIDIAKKINGTAENLIEECMLAANETVAEHTQRKNLPSLYRVHEIPTADKVDTLNQLLARFTLHISKPNEPRSFQKILAQVKGTPAEKIISNYALRTMQQARYSPENLGHFGLAAEFYTHFTSPIRRYPDLVVHRILKAAPAQLPSLEKKLQAAAAQSSERERRAVEIEREVLDLKATEFMAKFLWQKFDAVICSVTKFGFFVELENGVDGLVRAATLRDDYYIYSEKEFSLIGKRTGKVFKIGDEVRVQLVEANVKLRQLAFELVEGVVAKDLIATV